MFAEFALHCFRAMKTRLKKITVTLEESLVRWTRVEAARSKLTVSRFFTSILEERRQRRNRCDAAMKRALSRKPFAKSDGKYLSREDVHNRDGLRTSPKTKNRPAHI
jgi:hypothetical protein